MSARPGRRAVIAVLAVAMSGVLPVFLTGGLAVQMGADLGFGPAALGGLNTAYFAASALASAVFGRLAERVGPQLAMRGAAFGSALCLAGIATLATRYGHLVALLIVAGLANAMAQPASNALVAEHVRPERRGLAFGIKQSAIPGATLLGGLAVPLVALTVGWRAAFGAGAFVAVGAAFLVPTIVAERGRRAPGRGSRAAPVAALVLLALAAGLGAAAAGSIGTFVTTGGVDVGLSEGGAGILQAAGSLAGLSMRLFLGWRVDRSRRRDPAAAGFRLVALLVGGGSIGFVLMATGVAPVYVAGTFVAFVLGWGWPGLFNYAVVNQDPDTAASTTGITQTGVYFGAATGPLLFGVIAEQSSFSWAWLVMAAAGLGAAVTVLAGGRRLARDRRPAPSR